MLGWVLKALRTYVKSITWLNNLVGRITAFTVLVITGLLLFEIVSRYGFNSPNIWVSEIGGFIFWGYAFVAGGYTLLRRAHVRMDALYDRWSARRRATVDAVTFSMAGFFLGTLLWRTSYHAYLAVESVERTPTMAATLTGPVKVFLVIGVVLLLLQAIAFFIRDVRMATVGKELE